MARRATGEGSYSTDPRTGMVIYQNRAWIPGTTVRGRGRTRTEALARARERRDHVLAGRPSGRAETAGELFEAWIELSVQPTMTQTAARVRHSVVRNWLVPHLGSIAAHQLRPSDLEAMYRAAQAAKRKPSYITAMKTFAGSAYSWALGDGRIAGKEPGVLWNPAKASRLPDLDRKGSLSAPTSAQVEGLLQKTDPIFNGGLWRAMADCALRPSEAAGLRWEDIDHEQRVLRITGALRHDKELGEYRWMPGTKNKKPRTIPFGPELGALLSQQRHDLLELQMRSLWESNAWAGNLVFRQPADGRGWQSTLLYHRQQEKLTSAGVEWFSPYQLRHYLPTRLARDGVSVDVVANLLGDTVETTRRYYIDEPEIAIALDLIRTALGRES
jgi:integrase